VGIASKNNKGIFGDHMGLGKTIQIIAYLCGMFDTDKMKSALIVLTVAVIVNWESEFVKWGPGIRVEKYHESYKQEREHALLKVQRSGVLLTSYGTIVNDNDELAKNDERDFS